MTLLKTFAVPVLFLSLLSCNKKSSDVPGWTHDTMHRYNSGLNTLMDDVAPKPQEFTVPAGLPFSAGPTAKGVLLIDGSFTQDRQHPYTGTIKIAVSADFTNTERLAASLQSGSGTELLASGGALFISATDDQGQALHILRPVEVIIPDKGKPNAGYSYYRGRQILKTTDAGANNAAFLMWSRDTPAVSYVGNSYRYSLYGDWANWRWTGLHRNLPGTQGLQTLSVRLPDGYGNANADVYALTDKGLLILDGDVSTQRFTSSQQVPVGTTLRLLVVSGGANGQYQYALRDAVLAANQEIVFTELTPISPAGLKDVVMHDLD